MGEPERTADEATLVHRQPARAVVAGAEQAAPRAGVVGLRSGRAEEGEGERQQPERRVVTEGGAACGSP